MDLELLFMTSTVHDGPRKKSAELSEIIMEINDLRGFGRLTMSALDPMPRSLFCRLMRTSSSFMHSGNFFSNWLNLPEFT
jgi:hypothetical protein